MVQDNGFAILIFASAIVSLMKYMPSLTQIFKKKKKPRIIMDLGSGKGGGPQAKQDLQCRLLFTSKIFILCELAGGR